MHGGRAAVPKGGLDASVSPGWPAHHQGPGKGKEASLPKGLRSSMALLSDLQPPGLWDGESPRVAALCESTLANGYGAPVPTVLFIVGF